MNIMIIINAMNHNKGSEALVRGTIAIIKKKYPDSFITVALTDNPTEIVVRSMQGVDKYINRKSYEYRYSIGNILQKIFWKLGFKKTSVFIRIYKCLKYSRKQDIIIRIAGDNYDKTYGNSAERFHIENMLDKKHSKAKYCLYNCSLEKSHIDYKVISDVSASDVFTVRESLSYNNFLEYFPKEKIHFHPDPAFVMLPQETDLPQGWESDNMVGVNLSNLILRDVYVAGKDKILCAYYNLVEYILNDTVLKIAFIPHVMNNADLSALSVLYKKYKDSNRVILIDNQELSAPELKYIISKCKLYIGARTHSTIAAYSSCIPTLVFGYSIKSQGIAQDLFGTTENYVVSSQNLSDEMALAIAFKWMLSNEGQIRKHLECIMPEYKQRVWETANVL